MFSAISVCVFCGSVCPVWFLCFFVLPADLQRYVKGPHLLDLAAGLLQTRHHALIELNLFGNEVL